MYILSGFISQNKLCESQGEVNELYEWIVYVPEVYVPEVYVPELTATFA